MSWVQQIHRNHRKNCSWVPSNIYIVDKDSRYFINSLTSILPAVYEKLLVTLEVQYD